MTSSPLDQLARSLARGGPRRWALKTLAAGALGVGMMTRGTRSSEALEGDWFEQCLLACRSSCSEHQHHHCPSFEACAASCSQAAL
jgi:hypothetical protein